MSSSTSAFKRFALPIGLVLVVAAAAAVFLLTNQSPSTNPLIPNTGGPVSVPIEMERGYNLKENQSQYKNEAVIPVTGSPVSIPSEVICGYDLKEDQFHCMSDPVIPVMLPLIPYTGGTGSPSGSTPLEMEPGYNLKVDQSQNK